MAKTTMTINLDDGDAARRVALASALVGIKKKYGPEAIMYLDQQASEPIEVIRTGAITLDLALGVGGIPRGRITEIYGENGTGKSTLCCHLAAECQKAGGQVVFIDAENALDARYAENIGVKLSESEGGMILCQPDYGEQAFELAEALIQSGGVDLIIVDSMAALVPKSEIDGDLEKQSIGSQARMIARGLLRLTAMINKTKTAVVFTNQTRVDIGGWSPHGPALTTSGGRAPKFWAGVRIELKRGSLLKSGDHVVGHLVNATVVKNKVYPPFKKATYEIIFPNGIDRAGGVLDAATKVEVVEQRGAHYAFGDVKLGVGRENARDFLRANPFVLDEITERVYKTTDVAKIVEEVEPRPEEL